MLSLRAQDVSISGLRFSKRKLVSISSFCTEFGKFMHVGIDITGRNYFTVKISNHDITGRTMFM